MVSTRIYRRDIVLRLISLDGMPDPRGCHRDRPVLQWFYLRGHAKPEPHVASRQHAQRACSSSAANTSGDGYRSRRNLSVECVSAEWPSIRLGHAGIAVILIYLGPLATRYQGVLDPTKPDQASDLSVLE